MKRIALLILAASFFLTGCSTGFMNMGDLMRPPKPTGENLQMQEALEAKLGADIILKYPRTGDYRTAYVECNVNDDTDGEVIVFYKLNSESAGIRMNILKKIDGKWESSGDIEGEGTDVDKVIIADLDADGINEIVVGWNVASSKEKLISVYNYHDDGSYTNRIAKRFSESYTIMEIMDFVGDGSQQILIVLLNSALKASTASLVKSTAEGYKIIGKTQLDGSVTAYTNILRGQVNDKVQGVYIDGSKGTNATITELVYYAEDALTAPFYDEIENITAMTFRESTTLCRDVDNDGIIEIPMPVPLPGYEKKVLAEQVRMTNWYVYTGKGYETKLNTVNNLSDGYIYVLSPAWVNRVSAKVIREERTLIFYEWVQDKGLSDFGPELLRIKTVPDTELENSIKDGFIKLDGKNGLNYMYKISNEDSTFGIKNEIAVRNFILL